MYVSECRETLLEHSMQAERVWLGVIGIAEAAEFIAESLTEHGLGGGR